MADFEIENGVLNKYRGKGSSVSIPKKLVQVIIPDGVTAIGKSAFSCCNGIESVIIPDSVKSIGYDAFYSCKSLKSVEIPESVKKIGGRAFSGCESLFHVKIPDTAEEIDSPIFSGTSGLESYPDGFLIHHGTLMEYSGLEKIVMIPESVKKIRNFALSFTPMETLIIPETVQKIDMDAGSDCYHLRCVTIYGMTYNSEETVQWRKVWKLLDSVRNFLAKSGHQERKSYLKASRNLLFHLDDATFQKILNTGEIFTEKNIDRWIQYANRLQAYEKQVLLMHYKSEHIGYQDIETMIQNKFEL